MTILGRPGRGTQQVEKSPSLKWATQFLTMTYDGASSTNVSIRMACTSFEALPCRKKKIMTDRVSMLLKSRAMIEMLPFSFFNKKSPAIQHKNRPLFPSIISIQSYDIVKQVGLRTYQHPLLQLSVHHISFKLFFHLVVNIIVPHFRISIFKLICHPSTRFNTVSNADSIIKQ